MNRRKQFTRALFFVFLLACLLTGLAGTMRAPVLAAPQLQAANIVISEFRVRGPSGANDEFVEIYNPTIMAVDISGWRIEASNNTGPTGNRYTFLTGTILQPGQHFLIVGNGYSGGVAADGVPPATLSSGIPDNGGIALTLSNGVTIIDQVGMTNCAGCYFETTPLASLGTNNLDRGYNRNIDVSSICIDTNNNATDFFLRSPSDPQNLSSSLTICGNPTQTPTSTSTFTNTVSPTSTVSPTNTPSPTNTVPTAILGTPFPVRTLLINEVAWMGTIASTADEWIELYNPGTTPIDLTRWRLQSTDLSPDIQLSGTIPAGGYYLLERTDDTTVSDIAADLIYSGELNNTGEILRLIDPAGGVVDTANFDGGAWPGGSSATFGSMERRGVIADSDTAWITNTGVKRNGLDANGNPINGTPKNSNWAFSVTPTVSLTPTRTRTPTLVPTITRTPTPLPPPPLLVINEFVPRPGHDWNGDGVINEGDEYIEILNHGVVDVNLSGHTLDDEVNIGSNPYIIPAITLKPGERMAFFESETGLRLSDGGDGVRLLKPNGQLFDAYNYRVVYRPDHAYCRYPDNGGADDWHTDCFPTPGRQNSLSGSVAPPPEEEPVELACPFADTQPEDYPFLLAECQPFGQNIFRPAFWDRTGWFGERYLPESPGKWPVFAD